MWLWPNSNEIDQMCNRFFRNILIFNGSKCLRGIVFTWAQQILHTQLETLSISIRIINFSTSMFFCVSQGKKLFKNVQSHQNFPPYYSIYYLLVERKIANISRSVNSNYTVYKSWIKFSARVSFFFCVEIEILPRMWKLYHSLISAFSNLTYAQSVH